MSFAARHGRTFFLSHFNSANYKQVESVAESGDAVFKAEKSISLFARRSKLPSTKRVTLKTIADTIVSLSHDAQDDLPSNSVVVLERYNVTGASGVFKRYPNGSDFKMELTFRLNRNGVASLDSSEVMLEDRVEYEKCEFVKPPSPVKANATKKEAASTPASETDDSAAKDAPKDEESNAKSDSDSKKEEEGGDQSGGTQDEKETPKDDAKPDSATEEKQVRIRTWHIARMCCHAPVNASLTRWAGRRHRRERRFFGDSAVYYAGAGRGNHRDQYRRQRVSRRVFLVLSTVPALAHRPSFASLFERSGISFVEWEMAGQRYFKKALVVSVR